MQEHRLTRSEATSLMVGAGVGAGIMAVPFLTRTVGLLGLALILPIAWGASAIIHLMLAEVLFRTGRDMQIVELMRLYVLRGRLGQWLLWTVFALLTIAFLANLAAYVSGAAAILTELLPMPVPLAQVVIYLVSAGVVFFGLRAIGIAERLGAAALVGLIVVLLVGAARIPFRPMLGPSGSATEWMALYGMVMYALWTFYSVPQVVRGLGPDREGAVRAIILGLGINGVLTAAVAFIALAISEPVTEVAIIGISARLGAWAGTIGSLFVLLALVTSYWSVSLALADILRERTDMPPRLAWLLATLPPLVLLWIGAWQFLEYLRLAAGATALVVALITLPMYRQARRSGAVSDPAWTLGKLGSPFMLALMLLALIVMAAGSLVAVD